MAQVESLRHAVDAAKAGQPALARVQLQKAAESNPDDPAVWLWMAWLADSPLNMVQCLETALRQEQSEVAQAGLAFARGLAAFQTDEESIGATETSRNSNDASESEQETAPATSPSEEESATETNEPDFDSGRSEESDASDEKPVDDAAVPIEESAVTQETGSTEIRSDVNDNFDLTEEQALLKSVEEASLETELSSAPSETKDTDSDDRQEGEATATAPHESQEDEPVSSDEQDSPESVPESHVPDTTADEHTGEPHEPELIDNSEVPASDTVAELPIVDTQPESSPSFWTPPQPVHEKNGGGSSSLWSGIQEVTRSITEAETTGTEDAAPADVDAVQNPEPSVSGTAVAEPVVEQPPAWPTSEAAVQTSSQKPGELQQEGVLWRAAQSDWFQLEAGNAPAAQATNAGMPSQSESPDTSELPEPSTTGTIDDSPGDPGPAVDLNQEMQTALAVSDEPQATTGISTNTDNDGQLSSEVFDLAALTGNHSGQNTVAPAQGDSSNGRTVLVVDDSPTIRKLVAMTLEKRGFKVVSAFDGVAAIREIAAHNPSLILMDVNMPRLDGYQLCKLVRKHETTRHIPVLMLTGKDGMFDKLRGRLVGCSGYISKPFVPEELVGVVEQLFGRTTPTN